MICRICTYFVSVYYSLHQICRHKTNVNTTTVNARRFSYKYEMFAWVFVFSNNPRKHYFEGEGKEWGGLMKGPSKVSSRNL